MTRKREGFTLIELLAVMAVIGILIGIILGISGYATYKSDEAKANADIENIKQLLDKYRADKGVYPSGNFKNTIKDLDKTFFQETDGLRDPWGQEYQYQRPKKYVAYVWSKGPDDESETKDDIGEFPPD